MEPTGAGILQRHFRVACQLLLQCRIPELRLRRADILVHMPQAGGRQRDTTRGSSQWTGIRGSDRRIVDDDDSVIRGILNHVKRDIAEVAFIADAVAAANRSLACSEYVIREADTRRNRAVLRAPQAADRTLWSGKYLAVANRLKEVSARAIVEVRFQVPFVVMLHAIVLVAHAIVHGKPWRQFE